MLFLSRVRPLATPRTVAHQDPLSMELSRQEYRFGLPFPFPGDLPDPGIQTVSLLFSALAGRLFYHCTTWEVLTKRRALQKRGMGAQR